MDVMVAHMSQVSGATLCETVRMASLTAAERVGMDREIGSVESGNAPTCSCRIESSPCSECSSRARSSRGFRRNQPRGSDVYHLLLD
jgi:hypothetical protein